MRFHYAALALALVAAGLTGCVGQGDDDGLDGAKVDTGNGSGDGDATYPEPIVKTPLEVSAEVSEEWVRPGDTVTLTASADGATEYLWFLAPRESGGGGGHDHGGDDDGGGGHDHGGGFDTGNLAPGTRTEAVAFEEPGRYTFHCHPHPWMTFTVTVTDEAEESGVQHVALIDPKDDYTESRFAPGELTIQPGAEVVFWNNGTATHTVTQDGFWQLIPATGESVEFTPTEEGDFNVIALARDDGTGEGTAEARLLVDSNRPADSEVKDPITGELVYGIPDNPAPERQEHTRKQHNIRSDYDIKEIRITFEATSQAPADPSVTLSIAPQAQDAIGSQTGADGEIVLQDLDAGVYSLVITGEQGLNIEYEINVEMDYSLVPPAVRTGGGGHDHGGHDH